MKIFRKQKIKLVKDLSSTQNNLCQSLLDISQFDNIDQTYQKRKLFFQIPKRNVTFKPYVPPSEQQAQYDMTPTQKIQYYKQLKIKQRYNQQSVDRLKKLFKIRKSKIPNLLNSLNQSMKKQTQQLFDKQVKKSQQKLKFYRSQGKLNQSLENQSKFYLNHHQSRQKFFSLKTGKPQMNQSLFPTFQQFVDGKNRAKLQQKYEFDVSKIQKNLNTFYTQVQQNPQEEQPIKNSLPLSVLATHFQRARSYASNRNISQGASSQRLIQSKTANFKKRLLISSNLQRYSQQHIQKSERSSNKIVKTMSNFYKSKNNKKEQYNNMVEYYDHDRPLTNQIRRKQYEFMKNDQKIKQLKHYRSLSQNKRLQILAFNSQTYKQMLNLLSRYHEDDIPISLQILKSIKHLMKRQYIFGQQDVRRILRQIKNRNADHNTKIKELQNQQDQKQDFMIQPVIDVINKSYNYRLLWIDL